MQKAPKLIRKKLNHLVGYPVAHCLPRDMVTFLIKELEFYHHYHRPISSALCHVMEQFPELQPFLEGGAVICPVQRRKVKCVKQGMATDEECKTIATTFSPVAKSTAINLTKRACKKSVPATDSQKREISELTGCGEITRPLTTCDADTILIALKCAYRFGCVTSKDVKRVVAKYPEFKNLLNYMPRAKRAKKNDHQPKQPQQMGVVRRKTEGIVSSFSVKTNHATTGEVVHYEIQPKVEPSTNPRAFQRKNPTPKKQKHTSDQRQSNPMPPKPPSEQRKQPKNARKVWSLGHQSPYLATGVKLTGRASDYNPITD